MDDRSPVNLRCSALVIRDNQVLLCRRTHEGGAWVLPGGTPRRGESAESAVRREVAEETGLEVAPERIAFVLDTSNHRVDDHLIEIVFTARDLNAHVTPTSHEDGLVPAFVALSALEDTDLLPPIAGYLRGFVASRRSRRAGQFQSTAAYLGNLWREVPDGTGSPQSRTPQGGAR